MGQRGYLVRTNNDDTQQPFGTSELNDFLAECGIVKAAKMIGVINSIFESVSSRRGELFWRHNVCPYSRENDSERRMAVWGVKGRPCIKRISFYAQWYVCSENELMGDEFFREIFGTAYMTEEQMRTLDEPQKLLERGSSIADMGISRADKELVCGIVMRLWQTQLKNADGRLVIRLGSETGEESTEKRSMELLRQVYLLLPPELRLSLGFGTNVTAQEILKLVKYAFYIFVVPSDCDLSLLEQDDRFTVFDIDRQTEYECDPSKMKLLRKMVKSLKDGETVRCLSALEKVKAAQYGYSSFDFLEDMYREVLSDDIYWWRDKVPPKTIEELKSDYDSQLYVMEDEVLHKKAMNAFYLGFLQHMDYASQIKDLVVHPSDQSEMLLEFCSGKLKLDKWVEAFKCGKADLAAEAERQNRLERRTFDLKIQGLEKDKTRLNEKVSRLEHEKSELDSQCRKMLQQKKQEYSDKLNRFNDDCETRIAQEKRSYELQADQLRRKYDEDLQKKKNESDSEKKELKETFDLERRTLEETFEISMREAQDALRKECDRKLQDLRDDYEEEIERKCEGFQGELNTCKDHAMEEKEKVRMEMQHQIDLREKLVVDMALKKGYKNIFVQCDDMNQFLDHQRTNGKKRNIIEIALFTVVEVTIIVSTVLMMMNHII